MSNYYDHAEQALHYAERASNPSLPRDEINQLLGIAKIYADLAKQEQTRIANIMRLWESPGTPAPARSALAGLLFNPEDGYLRAGIAEIFGVDPDETLPGFPNGKQK